MKLFLNPKRWRQWMKVVGHEVAWRNFLPVAWHMAKAAWGMRGMTRGIFWRRMRACHNCLIYNRDMKTCRPFIGSKLGCGCYAPFLASSLTSECWAHTSPHNIKGWPSAH
jgi:hypothetical protein